MGVTYQTILLTASRHPIQVAAYCGRYSAQSFRALRCEEDHIVRPRDLIALYAT